MNDRGEKIVSLAREMLRSDFALPPPELAGKKSISLKVLCVAAIISALGSYGVTTWADEARRPLTRYERVELDALVFYAIQIKGLQESVLRREIENRTGFADFSDFSERDFLIARSYLQGEIR